MTSPVRIALWGVGGHARRNLIPAVREADGVEIAGVFTRDPESRAWAAAELSCTAFADPDDLLASDVEAVFLATPPSTHFPIGSEIVAAGKYLWCEKPLVLRAGDAVALSNLAASNDVAVLEAYMFRYHPQFCRVVEVVRSGTLGEPRVVEASFGIPHLDSANHRYDSSLGGGALADTAGYPALFARELMGSGVKVRGALIITEEGWDVDTSGSALLSNGDGTTGLIAWGFGLSYRNEAEVWGSEGRLIVPRAFSKSADFRPDMTIVRSEGTVESVEVPAANHFALMLTQFAAELRAGRAEDLSGSVVEQAVFMDEIRRSAIWPGLQSSPSDAGLA